MPEAPDYIPGGDRKRWTAIWKNAMDKYGDEGRAYQIANGVILHGKSYTKSRYPILDNLRRFAAVADGAAREAASGNLVSDEMLQELYNKVAGYNKLLNSPTIQRTVDSAANYITLAMRQTNPRRQSSLLASSSRILLRLVSALESTAGIGKSVTRARGKSVVQSVLKSYKKHRRRHHGGHHHHI